MGMGFKVQLPKAEERYHGVSTYRIESNGALIVEADDGRTITYGPSYWQRIEEMQSSE